MKNLFLFSPHCAMNFLLWIPWALCTIIPLTSFYLVLFLFSLQYISAQLDPQDLESGDLVICTAQLLCSPPSLPPLAPGTHSLFIEALNCWTPWIASHGIRMLPGLGAHSRGWAALTFILGGSLVRLVIRGGCGLGVLLFRGPRSIHCRALEKDGFSVVGKGWSSLTC